eukprot:GHVT01080713.1.p1 GENE.GHVT01080713.1~~GHVT01080713.1.p1  ORF type:complete len:1048 (-),score=57.55 GHVT01080713.1:3339-6482(-)
MEMLFSHKFLLISINPAVAASIQAVKWIKHREKKNLIVKTFSDDYLRQLEVSIQFGRPFLFELSDIELDPLIDTVLDKPTDSLERRFVLLGDKEIELSPDFSFYFTTKASNPKMSPELMSRLMVINYVVTHNALTDQLLNAVVAVERPDLEKQRKDLIQRMSQDKQVLKHLEGTLLAELAQAKGSLLENDDIIETLRNAKARATELSKSLQEADHTSVEIEKIRVVYRTVVQRGSILFFAAVALSVLSPMYEISLDSYLSVFDRALRSAKPDPVLNHRLKNVMLKLMQTVYDYFCTGLFEQHKLLFSFHMATLILEGNGELDPDEYVFFVAGNTSLVAAPPRPPELSWLSVSGWKDLQLLVKLNDAFHTLLDDIQKDPASWKAWYDKLIPEDDPLPGTWAQLDGFRRLLVVRVVRPDRVYNAVKVFISNMLGEYYVQPPSLQFEYIYKQSSERCPVVLVLCPGADPQTDIQMCGQALGFSGHKLKFLALGQGMGAHAEQHIEIGAQAGHWIVLQNCHLLTSWLPSLEKLLEGLNKPHPDFRLWLTTQPVDAFPIGILRNSFKVVTEPPDGLRQNLKRSYAKLKEADLVECGHRSFKSLVYVISFFHAVVEERRKYGKIGWNMSYDFNETDLKLSINLISLNLAKEDPDGTGDIPWTSLRCLIGQVIYGGRIVDDHDQRILTTYLEEYMGDFLFDESNPFHFSRKKHLYTIPPVGTRDQYLSHISDLPLISSPNVFGLHPNAEIDYFTECAKSLWQGLSDIRANAPVGASRHLGIAQTVMDVASEILGKLPKRAIKIQETNDLLSPLTVLLKQEVERFAILCDYIEESLVDLKCALQGESAMSKELEDLAKCLEMGILPDQWARRAPPTLKPLGSWIAHLIKRFDQYIDWATNGQPKVFWMSGMHVPESLVTAILQTACRKKGWSLDKATLHTEVTSFTSADQLENSLDEGAYIQGLYIEGARWDLERNCLAMQSPQELVCIMPIVRLVPVEEATSRFRNSLQIPVYVTRNRRDNCGNGWVFNANLETRDHPSLWILQGVAILLNTDA